MSTVLYLTIALCGVAGLLISGHIHNKKRRHEPLTCPIGHSCDTVIHSEYSKFMNMPVEILGVAYYGLITATYFAYFMMPSLPGSLFAIGVLGVSGLAFIFSVYLIAVQMFILRQWCTWCIISATLCTLIFFAAAYLSLGGISL